MTASPGIATAKRSRANTRIAGVLLVIASAFGYGSGALFAKPVYATGVDWLTLLFWRFTFAALFSWGWLLLRSDNRASLRLLTRRRVAVLVALGVFFVLNSGTYFAALQDVPVSLAALIVYIYPALVAVLSLRFGRRLTGGRAWFALGMALLGCALAVGGIPAGELPPVAGLVLVFASAVIYAVWIVMAARLGGERRGGNGNGNGKGATGVPPADSEVEPTAEETDSAPAAAIMTTATAIAFGVGMVGAGRSISPAEVPIAAWPGLLGVALFATAVALQAFYAGARRIGAARAALISTIEPLYTITLAALLLGESLSGIQLLGGVLIIGAVLLAESGQLGQRAHTAEP